MENKFIHEMEKIKEERKNYHLSNNDTIMKFFDYLSFLFLIIGFISLILIFFDKSTLINSTCFFIISYVLSPTDGDRYEKWIKNIVEDIWHIRAHVTLIDKKINNGEKNGKFKH